MWQIHAELPALLVRPCVAAGLLLNSILVAQILVYGNKGVAAKKVKGRAAVKKAA